MPSKNKKQVARADAQAVETAVEDERQKAELLAERPNVGKSSLRGNPDEILAQVFTLYFFMACYWNTLERNSTDRWSVDDPNMANLLLVVALTAYWTARRGLPDVASAVVLPMVGAVVFVCGCYRHVMHRDMYNADPKAFVPGAWMQLAGIQAFGALVAVLGGVSAAISGKITPGVPIGVAVLALAVLFASPIATPSTDPAMMYPHPVATTSIYIPITDGVRLAADIYLPDGLNASATSTAATNETNATVVAAAPVVLQLTRYGRSYNVLYPYNKFDLFNSANPRKSPGIGVFGAVVALRNAGYVVVSIDVRGTGASFGRRGADLHPRELKDHAAVVAWAREQPWCNGSVALLGTGVDGTSVALATARGAMVDAVATVDAPADPYSDQLAPGGIACPGYYQGATALAKAAETGSSIAAAMTLDDDSWHAYFLRNALGEVRAVDGWENEADRVMAAHHGNFDLEEYANAAFPNVYKNDVLAVGKTSNLSFASIDAADRIAAGLTKYHVPVLSVAGYTAGRAAAAAAGLYSRGVPEGSQLVLGPWGGAGKTCFRATAQDCTAATTTPAAAVVTFLDCAIRGRCAAASPVAYFTTGSGAGWHTATAWPPVDRTTIRTLFLTPAALATATPTTGHIEFTVDAAATTGVRSRWNTARGLLGLPVVYTEGARAGRVGFDSAPLEVASTLVGSPALLLTLEPIDGTDIAIFAYLEEIAADGAVTYVSEGQLLASHPVISRVNGSAAGHPEPLCRNYTRSAQRSLVGPTVVEVVMQPVAHTFAVGSHMRLSLAGADADNFDTSKLDVASSWKIYIGESSIALAMQN